MKNRKMALGLLTAIASVGFVMSASAADLQSHNLPGYTVEGDHALAGGMVNTVAKVGVLGDKSVMDIPYSEMSMTEKTLETFYDPAQPLANVLANNPSIRTSTSSSMYTDFSMRGINMNGNHMMINGVPSLYSQFTYPPAHIMERVDITSGPNAGVNGVSMSNNGTNSGASAAPGNINIITKRAQDTPITRYTQTYSGRGNWGEFIDVGRRFGKNNEWGVRVNAEYMDGAVQMKGSDKNEKNIFINIDNRGRKSNTNLHAGYFDLRVDGAQRWFQFAPTSSYTGHKLPKAPDTKNNYDFPGTTKHMNGYIWTLNHDVKMNDNWEWFANFGYSARHGDKQNQGANINFNELGNFVDTNYMNEQNEKAKNGYGQLGIRGKFNIGEVKNNVVLSLDRSWARYWNKGLNYHKGDTSGNLYTGIIFADTSLKNAGHATPQWDEVNVGLTIADTLEFGKGSLMLGASRKHESFQNLANKTNWTNDHWLPTYGITYKPVKNLAFYAGHTEALSRGLVVTNSSTAEYTNAGVTMPPVRSKQNEIGIKYEAGKMLTTLAYFDMTEANRFDITHSDGKKTKVDDGENEFKGFELTVNGKPADKWTVTGGILYLDAQRKKTLKGAKDGFFVNGVAKWSGVLGCEYKPSEAWGITAHLTATQKANIESTKSTGKYEIPAYALLDLGVNYKTKFNNVPVRLSATCYNVFDKDYWMGRGGSYTFGLGTSRTFALSASFDI